MNQILQSFSSTAQMF